MAHWLHIRARMDIVFPVSTLDFDFDHSEFHPTTVDRPALGQGQSVVGSLQDLTVMIIDDNEPTRRALARILERDRIKTILAEGLSEARILVANGARPNVVIADYRMADGDGASLLQEFRDILPHAERILMTGEADAEVMEEGVNRAGICAFLRKPWSSQEVTSAVQTALALIQQRHDHRQAQERLNLQNSALREVTSSLENRVQLRTQQLSTAKKEWETVFDSIDDPIMIVDKQMRVIRGNLALANHLGHDVKDVINKPCHTLRCHSPNTLDQTENGVCVDCPVAKVRATGTAQSSEVKTRNGRYYSLRAHPFVDQESGSVVCHYRDITEQRVAQNNSIQTDKLASLGILAGGVAHEINNPIGAILALSQVLQSQIRDNAEHEEYLTELVKSAHRCKNIVDRLLRFSRQNTGSHHVSFDINLAIEEASLIVRHACVAKDVELTLDLSLEAMMVDGNFNEMVQVVLNLISNAQHATPRGGKIVAMSRKNEDGKRVDIHVIDNGKGIPQESLHKIFDPFFTTKTEGEGTGLGLAVTYGIVQEHHGTIDVSSELNVGTNFVVSLPVNGAS